MKVQFTVPDELYDRYETLGAMMTPKSGPTVAMTTQLERFRNIAPSSRYLLLVGNERDKLEKVLGGDQLQTAEQLLEKVERLCTVEISGVSVQFSTSELKELNHRATKKGITLQEEIEYCLKVVKPLMFGGY